jgi:hypothetical protein
LVFDPASPATYGIAVNASCSCTNPEANAVLTRNGTDVTLAENDQYINISAGNHSYECSVIETANYLGATSGVMNYVVNPALTILNLTSLPGWNETEGTQTNVSCSADNLEVIPLLYRNGTPVSNPDVQTLVPGSYDYLCNATASQNYSAPLEQQNTLTINALPSIYVLWNQPLLDLGSGDIGSGALTGNENITATGNNTNVFVDCVSGDCAVIADMWIDGANMTDNETQQVDFSCSNSSVGNFTAIFDVTSNEFIMGDQINVTCEILPLPPVLAAWNQSTLDLGSGERGAGVLTGNANITSTGANNNVSVACSSGNCTEITDNWTDGTNMIDGESLASLFTCNDSTEGSYSAVFDVVSNEDIVADQLTVSCVITPPVMNTGDVRLNEYMAQLSAGNDWVEIYNNDVNIINLTGWTLNDSIGAMTTLSGTMNPGDFLYFEVSNRLNNAGDDIILIDSALTTIDSHTYASSQPDVAVGRYPDATGSWQDMGTATPGSANIPVMNVLWSTATLDLGSGNQGAGVLTGNANITSASSNNNVSVACVSGSCSVISDNWTDGTNMIDAQSEIVAFTCNDSAVGSYAANFSVASNEYPTGDLITVSCQINLVPNYGVSLTDPADLATTNASNAVYTITVTNTGNQVDSFDLAVNNINSATTAQLNQTTITNLASLGSVDITLTVGDATPGTYAVNVTATSQTDGNATDEIDTITTVSAAPVYGVSVVNLDGNQEVTNTQTAVYNLQITNTGNQADSFDLTVNNLDSADTASLNQSTITNLNPGASANVLLSVADSTPALYSITVTAVSQTDASANYTTANIQTNVVQAAGNLTGTVSDSDNTIYNARVDLKQGIAVKATTYTDANGYYSFADIAIGSYTLAVTKPGYNDNTQTISIVENTNTVRNVVLTPAVFSGTISGTVLDGTDGVTTISGATVRIKKSDTGAAVQLVTSGVSGDYVINGLPPTVGFTYDINVDVPYGGYTQSFGHTGVSLTSGQTLTGKDIYLLP